MNIPKILRSKFVKACAKILLACVMIGTIAVIFFGIYLYHHFEPYRKEAENQFSIEKLQSNLSSNPLPTKEIPRTLVDVFVVIHEPRFFEYHHSFDWLRFWRVLGRHSGPPPNAICLKLTRTFIYGAESGQTRHRQAMIRHFCSIEIEKNLTKEQILFYTLNTIRFSPKTKGIRAGAQAQFGRDITELSEDELISLARTSLNPKYVKHPFPKRIIEETKAQIISANHTYKSES